MNLPTMENMPHWLEDRHRALNFASRECYRLRDLCDDQAERDDFEAIGDDYFARAIALLDEWYA